MEVLSAYDRVRVLLLMAWWRKHWPEKFMKAFSEARLRPRWVGRVSA